MLLDSAGLVMKVLEYQNKARAVSWSVLSVELNFRITSSSSWINPSIFCSAAGYIVDKCPWILREFTLRNAMRDGCNKRCNSNWYAIPIVSRVLSVVVSKAVKLFLSGLMGRREAFCDVITIVVLPHLGCYIQQPANKRAFSMNNITSWDIKSRTSWLGISLIYSRHSILLLVLCMERKKVPIRVELFACGKTFLGLNFWLFVYNNQF